MRFRSLLFATGGAVLLAVIGSVTGAGRAVAQMVEATLVRSADNPARQPVQAGTSGRVFGPGFFTSQVVSVPAGKRLVIEYLSAWIVDAGFTDWFLEVDTVQNGTPVRHMAPIAQQTSVNFATNFIAGQPLRLYADPGTTVTIAVTRAGSLTNAAADVSAAISGHLVDLQ